jgi:hypothetical protein
MNKDGPAVKHLLASLAALALLVVGLVNALSPASARPAAQPAYIALHQDAAGASIAPHLGGEVTFDTAYPSSLKAPRIEVLCYQAGALVYGEAGSADQAQQADLTGSPGFVLGGGGSTWLTNGGAADCTANLFYFGSKAGKQTYNLLASTQFAAAG